MKQKKTVAITGAGGMLGDAVVRQFSDNWEVRPFPGDVTDSPAVSSFMKRVQPDAIIHLAALTDLEYCESHPARAYEVNTLGVANVLAPAVTLNIPFVTISTARVFPGTKKSYREYDLANPVGIYSKSKYAGEVIARAYQKSIIIRAGWMVGGGPTKDKKFVNKIIQRIAAGGKELTVVSNNTGNITYTYDLAKAMKYLVTRRAFGIYHCVSDGETSRLDIARFIVRELGLENAVKIIPVSSDSWNKEYFSPRPSSERLANAKLKKLNPALIRPWRVCLAEYLNRFDWFGTTKS